MVERIADERPAPLGDQHGERPLRPEAIAPHVGGREGRGRFALVGEEVGRHLGDPCGV